MRAREDIAYPHGVTNKRLFGFAAGELFTPNAERYAYVTKRSTMPPRWASLGTTWQVMSILSEPQPYHLFSNLIAGLGGPQHGQIVGQPLVVVAPGQIINPNQEFLVPGLTG